MSAYLRRSAEMLLQRGTRRAVVYGGDSDFELSDASVIGWKSLARTV